jgi:hypothetical protein
MLTLIPIFRRFARWRHGSRTVNSVNASTSLSTVIVASLQRFLIGAKSQIFGAPSQDLLASVD